MDPILAIIGGMTAAIGGLFSWLVKLLYDRGSDYREQRDAAVAELKAHTDVLPKIVAQLDRLERKSASRSEGQP